MKYGFNNYFEENFENEKKELSKTWSNTTFLFWFVTTIAIMIMFGLILNVEKQRYSQSATSAIVRNIEANNVG